MPKGTKGRRVEGWARVQYTGSAEHAGSSLESPYVVLRFINGVDLTWHSNRAYVAADLNRGEMVYVWAFAYGDSLRRVTLAIQYSGELRYFGMKRKSYARKNEAGKDRSLNPLTEDGNEEAPNNFMTHAEALSAANAWLRRWEATFTGKAS